MKFTDKEVEGLMDQFRALFEERLQEVRRLLQDEVNIDTQLRGHLPGNGPQKSSLGQ